MHQRAALDAGHHGLVERLGVRRRAHDHAAARTAQGLVGRGRDEVGETHRRRMEPRRDEAGGMRDVGHQGRADLARDVAERGEVDRARERRAAGDDQLRPMLARQVPDLVEVDSLGVLPDTVRDDRIELARVVHRAARGEMSAVREVGAEHGVAGLEQREVDGHVGLRTRVGLHVGVLGAEELLGAGDGEVLDDVDDLAAAIIAAAGVAFGVLVGQHRPDGLQHGVGDEVLGGDQLEVPVLPLRFFAQSLGDLGIDVSEPEHLPTPGLASGRDQ